MKFPGETSHRILNDRSWGQVKISLYETSSGRFDSAPSTNHRLLFHLSDPVIVAGRGEGQSVSQLRHPGELALVPAGGHACWEDAGPTVGMNVWLSPALIQGAAESLDLPDPFCGLRMELLDRDNTLFSIATLLREEVESQEQSDPLYLDSLFTALAVRVLRRFGRTQPGTQAKAHLGRRQFRETLDYIDGNIDQPLRLGRLAEIAGLSVSHFRLLFRQTTGEPVHQFVVRRRVQYARKLLVERRMTISEAALASGFYDQSHLARCMRQMLGVKPTDLTRVG